MADTLKLKIPLIAEGQSNAFVTYNEAAILLDAFTHPKAKDFDPSPPAGAVNGDAYIVSSSGASGEWTGKENNFTFYQQGWRFIAPAEGMTVYVTDEACFYTYRIISSVGAWRRSGPVTDAASVGGTYSQTEVNAIKTVLNNLLAELRTTGILKT